MSISLIISVSFLLKLVDQSPLMLAVHNIVINKPKHLVKKRVFKYL